MYMFSKLPHVIVNNDLFFNNSSIIKKNRKIFNVSCYQVEEMFKKNLKAILYNLFDKTFEIRLLIISSEAKKPLSIVFLISFPSGVFFSITSRNISPVEHL